MAALTGCSFGPTPSPPPEAPPRSDAGVQLFQWTWNAVAAECQAVGDEGFGWVLVSPPQEHVTGSEWWTSYQPVSYAIESRLGTRDEFAAMVEACRHADVDVIVDAVINHMAGTEAGTGWAGTAFTHYEYPGLWTASDFHHCDTIDGDIHDYRDEREVQDCELVNLADLDTGSPAVRSRLTAYLQDLLDLGASGFRIDAAKHMPAADIAAILDPLPDGVRIMQEVIRGSNEPITPEDYVGNGSVFEFGYAEELTGFVQGGSLSLAGELDEAYGLLPSDSAIVFVDNHDTERNGSTLNYTDGADYALAVELMLAGGYGRPMLYSGYAFSDRDAGPAQDADGRVLPAQCGTAPDADLSDGDWVCQHRWPAIAGMVGWRTAVDRAPVTELETDADYALRRGDRGVYVANADDDPVETTLDTGLAGGRYCDVIAGPPVDGACAGTVVEVGGDGRATVTVPPHGAVALHVGARLR